MKALQFTEAEAQAKVGTLVQSLIAFPAVPKGTVGRVTAAEKLGDGYDVAVEWDLPRHPHSRPLRDWFTRDEYERFL